MPVKNYYTVNGRIIGEKTAGGSRVDYLSDALGNVTGTVDQSANVINTYRYKPYGELLAKTGSGSDPSFGWVGTLGYRKTSRRFSDQYVRARHYGTSQGQWTTVDPLWPNEWQYAYVSARPLLWNDRLGLQSPYGTMKDLEDCRKKCSSNSIRYTENRTQLMYAMTCIQCCLNDREFTKTNSSGLGRMWKSMKQCAKVYRCRRHLDSMYGSLGAWHSFLWVDKDCDGKWDEGEFYGWDGPEAYRISKGQKIPRGAKLGECELSEDVSRMSTRDVQCYPTNCDPACVLWYIKTHFGKGKCWDPTVEKSIGELKAVGGFCATRLCWDFKDAIENACQCDLLYDKEWKEVAPDPKRYGVGQYG